MRWSIIRTIWFREMRDQMRDRRTLLMILGLPIVLYPLLGLAVLQFAMGFAEKPSIVGVVTGSEDLSDFPPRKPSTAGRHVVPIAAWLSATPLGSDLSSWRGAAALARASQLSLDYPYLVEVGKFPAYDA